ncbi:MAG: hypothetical protein NT013_09550 [Planctomycetia bacterium]|nr:hypothetical protein [Planctomycetia bacterium]
MSTAIRDLPSVPEKEPLAKSLEQIVAEYDTPEFTEAIMNHFHEAKRRALSDVIGAGLAPATETEVARR